MQVSDLEELSVRLQRVREQLANISEDKQLTHDSAVVQAAKACEFMLPATLTVRSLSETVDRKIANVVVLLERARRHEALPEAAQVAAVQGYAADREDYLINKPESDLHHGSHSRHEL